MENSFVKLLEDRKTCRLYKNQKLSDEVQKVIFEAARLTPSSFNLEPTTVHVVEQGPLTDGMFEACFFQKSVKTAPMTVVLTTLRNKEQVNPDGEYVKKRFERQGDLNYFIEDFRPYYQILSDMGEITPWLKRQAYIVLANMMNAATSVGVQSCAIEGFDEKKVADVLGLNLDETQVALVITFGYPDEELREHIRVGLDELVVRH